MPDFLTAIDWSQVLPFIAIGFAAQVIDGALGMAFGVINSTLLVTVMGVPPAVASASVHAVETFTTAASGVSHVVHRNVDWKLFRRLVIPGMIGAVAGATLLSTIDASVAKPFVMAYLACIGLYLLFRAVGGEIKPRKPRVVAPLGLVGGFLDAAGGGGWGPVVTSNLLIQARRRATRSARSTRRSFSSPPPPRSPFSPCSAGPPSLCTRSASSSAASSRRRSAAFSPSASHPPPDGAGRRVADPHQRWSIYSALAK